VKAATLHRSDFVQQNAANTKTNNNPVGTPSEHITNPSECAMPHVRMQDEIVRMLHTEKQKLKENLQKNNFS
jgi:hypothetical protein